MIDETDAQRRIRERRQARVSGAWTPPKPKADIPADKPVAKKAPKLVEARATTGSEPVAKPTSPRTPEGTWQLGELHRLIAPEVKYATFMNAASRYVGRGRGTGNHSGYDRADAAVLRLYLDSVDANPHRHVGPTMMAELADAIRAGEAERVPEVAARSGAFSVVYRPTWLP